MKLGHLKIRSNKAVIERSLSLGGTYLLSRNTEDYFGVPQIVNKPSSVAGCDTFCPNVVRGDQAQIDEIISAFLIVPNTTSLVVTRHPRGLGLLTIFKGWSGRLRRIWVLYPHPNWGCWLNCTDLGTRYKQEGRHHDSGIVWRLADDLSRGLGHHTGVRRVVFAVDHGLLGASRFCLDT